MTAVHESCVDLKRGHSQQNEAGNPISTVVDEDRFIDQISRPKKKTFSGCKTEISSISILGDSASLARADYANGAPADAEDPSKARMSTTKESPKRKKKKKKTKRNSKKLKRKKYKTPTTVLQFSFLGRVGAKKNFLQAVSSLPDECTSGPPRGDATALQQLHIYIFPLGSPLYVLAEPLAGKFVLRENRPGRRVTGWGRQVVGGSVCMYCRL